MATSYIILYYIILYCIILYCIILHYIILYYIILYTQQQHHMQVIAIRRKIFIHFIMTIT